VGTTSFNGVTYSTTSETLTGVMPAGSNGVNHGVFFKLSLTWTVHLTLSISGISIDGNAILLTVRID
jgi:hypothetical protein